MQQLTSVERRRPLGVGYVSPSTSNLTTDIVVDNCAICRNHIMDLCASTVSPSLPTHTSLPPCQALRFSQFSSAIVDSG